MLTLNDIDQLFKHNVLLKINGLKYYVDSGEYIPPQSITKGSHIYLHGGILKLHFCLPMTDNEIIRLGICPEIIKQYDLSCKKCCDILIEDIKEMNFSLNLCLNERFDIDSLKIKVIEDIMEYSNQLEG